MNVYLVRHAETDLNQRHIHQYPSTPLSEKGRGEALTVAEYLRQMNPDLLISSDHERALQTARIIGSTINLAPQTSNLFYEIIRPSSLYGRSHFCFETFKYTIFSVWNRKKKDWRYKDAENMHDIILRTKNAFTYLKKLSKKHDSIVIVSHSVFINLLVAHMCQEGSLSFWKLFKAFLRIKFTKNASVTHLHYLGKQKDQTVCEWQEL